VARSIEDILAEMRTNPSGVRFTEACKVVTHYFGEPRQSGTSHKVWKTPWQGDPRVNMQAGESGKAKAYQVRQAVAAIDAVLAQRAAATRSPPTPARARRHRPKKSPRR
jgi:hypothetical protein